MAGELIVIRDKLIEAREEAGEKATTGIDLHVHIHVYGGQALSAGQFASPPSGQQHPGDGRKGSGGMKLVSIFFISMAMTGGSFMLFKGGSSPSIKDLWTADNSKVMAEAAAALDANTKNGKFSDELWQPKPGPGSNPAPPSGRQQAAGSPPIQGGQTPAPTGPRLFGLN